jgi:pyruvate dehydrogenase E2 component (dihydrolipoamide acetyltransferase)
MDKRWSETVSKLDFAERWLQDGLRVIEFAGGICSINVDMGACAALISDLKREGIPMTYAPLIVCATAKALSRHSKLQKLVAGNRQVCGGKIDICLSVAGDAIVTPTVIIENADDKNLVEISIELRAKTPLVRARDQRMIEFLRQWGWLLPFGFLRRFLLRSLLRQLWYRRRASGTFQVTILPTLDLCVPLAFNTAAALGVGGILQRPVVIEGQVQARLTAPFTCSIDHKQWNGTDAATFLKELKNILENETFALLPTNTPTPVPPS